MRHWIASKFFRAYHERSLWWVGVVMKDYERCGTWYAPIPFNLILRPLWLIYLWARFPFMDSTIESEIDKLKGAKNDGEG